MWERWTVRVNLVRSSEGPERLGGGLKQVVSVIASVGELCVSFVYRNCGRPTVGDNDEETRGCQGDLKRPGVRRRSGDGLGSGGTR